MSRTMNYVVLNEITHAIEGQRPASIERFVQLAYDRQPAALLLPFYMYSWHTHEWQEYTLWVADPLPAILNHATYMAVDAPALHAASSIKRYFYSASMIAPLSEANPTARSVEHWVYHLSRQYYRLQQKTHLIDTHHQIPSTWLSRRQKALLHKEA